MKLTTPYIKNLDVNSPHNYHPTPQFKRESYILLNGKWEFALTENPEVNEYNMEIVVPFCPESAASGLETTVSPHHYMHYRRHFEMKESLENKKALLLVFI